MKKNIEDIAKIAGVSRTTVSRVLNDSPHVAKKTKDKVLAVIKKYDYSPNIYAKNLRGNDSNAIAVMVPDITNPFFGSVIKGISQNTENSNYDIVLYNTDEDINKERNYLKSLKQQQLKALIMTPTSSLNDLYYKEILPTFDFPIVLIDRDIQGLEFDGVFIDNYQSAYSATKILIQNGHSEIALISGPSHSKPGYERKQGYMKALESEGILVKDDLIFYGDFKLDSGYHLTKKILKKKERPTAIFSTNNLMTLGTLKALNEEKIIIPKDISLMGFDNLDPYKIFDTNISTVTRPSVQMGQVAMNLINKALTEKDTKKVKRIILKSEIELKGSEIKYKKELEHE